MKWIWITAVVWVGSLAALIAGASAVMWALDKLAERKPRR